MDLPVVIQDSAAARLTASLIFMHGLGDTGHGWASAFQAIGDPYIKYICPTAPVMPVTLNAGFQMPSWFDIKSLSVDADQDEDGIKKACQIVHSLIEEEVKSGVPSNRIVVGGFSQGGALALYSAFTYPKPLAGIVALSCWLPMHQKVLQENANCANKDTPIFQAHGDVDPLVIPAVGQLTAKVLSTFGKNHSFKLYPNMAHSSCEQEMDDVKTFVSTQLPPV